MDGAPSEPRCLSFSGSQGRRYGARPTARTERRSWQQFFGRTRLTVRECALDLLELCIQLLFYSCSTVRELAGVGLAGAEQRVQRSAEG